MQARAAVFTAMDEPLRIVDVEVPEPARDEVLLRMAAAGVCHTDLSVKRGHMRAPAPIVLGHEGAGVVEAVGEDVTAVAPGDHVVVSWVPQCGECFFCQRGQGYLCEPSSTAMAVGGRADGTTRLRWDGDELAQWSTVGTFATHTVVAEAAVVPVAPHVPLTVAALVGCGALTGFGAAVNDGDITAGDVVAVWGCGGVGLNVVQGARIAGAGHIIAIDPQPEKCTLAAELGADTTVDPTTDDVGEVIGEHTGGRGVDLAFEVVGRNETIDQAVRSTRRGGRTVLVGIPPHDARLNLRVFAGLVFQAKTIVGSWYGGSNTRADVPVILDHYASGRLDLDRLVSRTLNLDAVDGALEAIDTQPLARSMVTF